MNRYGNNNKVYTATVISACYNETVKAIRMELKFENGIVQKHEWPITLFRFKPGQDKDEEMYKTATLLLGKKIDVMIEP